MACFSNNVLATLIMAILIIYSDSFLASSRPRISTRLCDSNFISQYREIIVPSLKGIYFADLTPQIREIVHASGVKCGQVTILSRHTTTAITINEMEARLVDDARQFLLKLAPPAYPYLHNDLHLRYGPKGNPLMNFGIHASRKAINTKHT